MKLPTTPIISEEVQDTAIQQSRGEKNIIAQVSTWLCGVISSVKKVLGTQGIYNLKLSHLYALEVLKRMCDRVSTLNRTHNYDIE